MRATIKKQYRALTLYNKEHNHKIPAERVEPLFSSLLYWRGRLNFGVRNKYMNWKHQTIDILKIIFAFRRDPYLQFSCLLVTSGCLLLSSSILEIIVNIALFLNQNNIKNIEISNNYSTAIGIALILFGLSLFYFKFLRKKVLNKEYRKDTELIKKIFLEITSLRKLDFFIEKALYPYLVDEALDEFEVFENFRQSSYYHVYDETLGKLIEDFYQAWKSICIHWQSFTPTRNENILRPDTYMDLAIHDHVANAIDEVPKNAHLMHKNLMELLKYIRTTYKDIEI